MVSTAFILLVLVLSSATPATGFLQPGLAVSKCQTTHAAISTSSHNAMTIRMSAQGIDRALDGLVDRLDRRGLFKALASAAVVAVPVVIAAPVLADSTGKFSSKQTARNRYVPKIKSAVAEFGKLKGFIDKEQWAETSFFFEDAAPASKNAFNLLGSSLKRGEYPDKVSKAAQDEVVAFYGQVESIKKQVLAKNKAKALESYAAAQATLNEYLKMAEIE